MNRKFIVFGRNASNTLGQVRSIGEAGFNPILVWVGEVSSFLNSSKYMEEFYNVGTIEEDIDLICDNWGGDCLKSKSTPRED